MEPQRGGLHRSAASHHGLCQPADGQKLTIDGEAVVVGPNGLSQFHELRRRDGAKRAMLYAFDLLELDETDLRPRPLLDRKAVLKRLLSSMDTGIVLNEHIVADGAVVFAHACKLGAEGIVSKRIDAPYRSGRCSAWIKTKAPAAIAEQRQRSEAWNT